MKSEMDIIKPEMHSIESRVGTIDSNIHKTESNTHSTVSSVQLIGLGASTLDRFIVVPSFPTGREVQEALTSTTDGGGPVSTALAVAGKLGTSCAMIDRIGNDEVGAAIVRDFHKYNVCTDYIDIVDGAKSGVATILVNHSDGARAVFFERSTASELDETDIATVKDLIEQALVFHYNGRHKATIPLALDMAKSKGIIVSLDGGAQRYDERMDQLARITDVCIVALDFGEKYTGVSELKDICRIICNRGALIGGVTAGENGSCFMWPDGTIYECPPYPQETIVDTTGCGDSFHGAFLHKLIEELETIDTHDTTNSQPIERLSVLTYSQLENCARFASAVASINTQTVGGRSGLPTVDQIVAVVGQEL